MDEDFRSRYAGQNVLVAGAGGYIGSALVKALAAANPQSLILLDSSEFGLFEIKRWMAAACPDVSCESILGSVSDERLLREILPRLRPQTVFHAAAFKHVGLLERNPFAAIENNALGSYIFAREVARHTAARFSLLSTDKAANPHSVMGVSKRIAELLTLSITGAMPGANAIRLCNVIGSPGSVIPLFLEQIEQGRAISVTHPEASRYFMTRDQAVNAILAAGITACERKVLLPEFPDPVRIADLARFLIGDQNLPISFTGLQPGEKLKEDLIGAGESRVTTIDGPLTVIAAEKLSPRQADDAVERLSHCVAHRDRTALLDALCSIVPDYQPSQLMLECAPIVSQACR